MPFMQKHFKSSCISLILIPEAKNVQTMPLFLIAVWLCSIYTEVTEVCVCVCEITEKQELNFEEQF